MVSISQSLKPCIVQLVKAKYPKATVLEIDAVVCISLVKHDKTKEQIVVKVHEKDAASLDNLPYESLSEVPSKNKLTETASQTDSKEMTSISETAPAENFQQVFERTVIGTNKTLPTCSDMNMTDLSVKCDAVVISDEEPSPTRASQRECSTILKQSMKDHDEKKRKVNNSKTVSSKYPAIVIKQKRSYEKSVRKNKIKTRRLASRKHGKHGKHLKKIHKKHVPRKEHKTTSESDASDINLHSYGRKPKSVVLEKDKKDETFVCEYCYVCYSDCNALCQHTFEVHNMRTCAICWKSFALQTRYNAHMKTHSPNKKVVVINSAAPNEENIPTSDVVVGSLKCGICGELFDNEDPRMAQRHLSTLHNFQNLFTCVLCSEYFPNQTTFAQHRHKKHKDVIQLMCPLCCLRFTSKEFPHHQGECWSCKQSGNMCPSKPGISRTTVDLTGPPPLKRMCLNSEIPSVPQIHKITNPPNQNRVSRFKNNSGQTIHTDGNMKQAGNGTVTLLSDNNPIIIRPGTASLVVLDSTKDDHDLKNQKCGKRNQALREIPDNGSDIPTFPSVSTFSSSSLANIASLSVNPWSAADIQILDDNLFAQQIQCRLCRFISDTYKTYKKHCYKEHRRYSCNICFKIFSAKTGLKKHRLGNHSQELGVDDD